MASLTEGRIRFLTVETLIERSGVKHDPYKPEEWEKALGVLKKFETLEMITMDDKGDIQIINWEKRQETNLTGAERVRKHRAKKEEAKQEDLPDWLDKDAWAQWEQHRKEIRKKLTPTTKKRQLAMLEKNKTDHVAIIEKSIANGWTGLFEIKDGKKPTNKVESKPGKYSRVGEKV
jgi:hypothetical protein